MKKRAAILAFALLMSLPRAAAAAFVPVRDADETARCFATFMNLSHVANGLPSARERQRLMGEAVSLRHLIGPFADAAAEKIGSQAFYHRAALAGRADMVSLTTSGLTSPEAMGKALAERARSCKDKITSWGPPPASKPAADDVGAAVEEMARRECEARNFYVVKRPDGSVERVGPALTDGAEYVWRSGACVVIGAPRAGPSTVDKGNAPSD